LRPALYGADLVSDPRLKGRSILLLAPAEGWRNDVATAFRAAGAVVHACEGAEAAVTIFNDHEIDAVVYDEHRLEPEAQALEAQLMDVPDTKRRAPLIAIDDRDRRDSDNHELAKVVVDSVAQMVAMRWN
jgi:response regulator RpfG family c-di-GMP phosphodiesterase